MPGTFQQNGTDRQWLVFVELGHAAGIGHYNTQKAVAFAILSRSGLEELGQVFTLHGIDVRLQFGLDGSSTALDSLNRVCHIARIR